MDNEGKDCKQAVSTYCKQSEQIYGNKEIGCISLTDKKASTTVATTPRHQ